LSALEPHRVLQSLGQFQWILHFALLILAQRACGTQQSVYQQLLVSFG